MMEAKIGDVLKLTRTALFLTVVANEEYCPFTDDGKVNALEANSHVRMGEAVLYRNPFDHPHNFEKKVHGKLIQGLIYPDGKITAVMIVNASHSGRSEYTFQNIHEVRKANVLECVKIAVAAAFVDQYEAIAG